MIEKEGELSSVSEKEGTSSSSASWLSVTGRTELGGEGPLRWVGRESPSWDEREWGDCKFRKEEERRNSAPTERVIGHCWETWTEKGIRMRNDKGWDRP